jgi:hypothetical protein
METLKLKYETLNLDKRKKSYKAYLKATKSNDKIFLSNLIKELNNLKRENSPKKKIKIVGK